jgi:hypothetical protein
MRKGKKNLSPTIPTANTNYAVLFHLFAPKAKPVLNCEVIRFIFQSTERDYFLWTGAA